MLAGFILMGLPGTAEAGWDGMHEIRLGDTATAEIAQDPGVETHWYRFFAPKGTRIRGAIRVPRDSTVDPELKLFNVAREEMSLPLAGNRILPYTFEESGEFYFQVQATTGLGEYSLITRARYPSRYRTVTADGELDFSAVASTLLAWARVRRVRGSGAVPVIETVAGRFGEVPITEGAVLRRVRLPFSSDFAMEWRNEGTEGDVFAVARLRPPRRRRVWNLGPTDPPAAPSAIAAAWAGSGHADFTAEPFRHWDEDGAVSSRCARCHSTPGFRDFIGDDGTARNFGLDPNYSEDADNNAVLGTTVECDACHNPTAVALDTVVFPSGQAVTGLGPEARCMQCHQGRESTVSLNSHIDSKSPAGDDVVTAGLSFRNIHYFAAGVTLYGGGAMGAYQFEGKFYDGKNPHVEAYDTCVECHDPHSLERRIVDACANCHKAADGQPVATDDDLKEIRMAGSPLDYDGDGSTTEGIYSELDTMADVLYAAMQDYSGAVTGSTLVYDGHSYPYYFDTAGARYGSWTPNLLRAAYNYQYWQKDPGAFAHNPKYMLQILYDSIEALAGVVEVPEFEGMTRSDSGHFDGNAEAFRHWDREEDDGFVDRGEVSSSCARCHSPGGFDFYATYGVDITISQPVGDGLQCETCHVSDEFGESSPSRRVIPQVEFPSGVVIENESGDDDSFLCMSCHKGRESKVQVDERIAQGRPTFRNVHYLPAGSSLYGADVGVAYEYEGRSYNGKWGHFQSDASQCAYCHLPSHTFRPQLKAVPCAGCHFEAGGDITRVRLTTSPSGGDNGLLDTRDYDGDEDGSERLKDELATYGARVLVSMQDYAEAMSNATVNKFIVYSDHTYPYWMNDLDRDRELDPGEDSYGNAYSSWDATLAKAAFNYQYWKKEPGLWAHNRDYGFQLLYDTIEDLGGNTTSPTQLYRPPGPDEE